MPPTSITGAGRSACPQEGAGNLSERFLAKEARHAQWHANNRNGFWRKKLATRSGINTAATRSGMHVQGRTSPATERTHMNIILREVEALELEIGPACPEVPATEYDRRMTELYASAGVDWVIVYGDREHAANLVFLTNFDPRFEEALLAIGPAHRRVLLVGNEGLGYISQAALSLDIMLAQSLSLMGQPRDQAPRLVDLLSSLGISAGAQIGVVGWKYLEAGEDDDLSTPAFVPALLVSLLRRLVGPTGTVRDLTALLMHPGHGMKARNGAAQIAQYAWAAERASMAVLRIVEGACPEMTEYEAVGLMGYQGEPLSCHVMLSGGHGAIVGLRSPSARMLAEGDGLTTAVGYRGSLCCRAGLLQSTPDEAFVTSYVIPYFRAVATWWQSLRIGATGDSINAAVLGALHDAPFRPALNPGHLIAVDEWTHTPIRPGSTDQIASGMALQCDIIPTPMPDGWALNCEDSVAIADATLRAELAAHYPELWVRIIARREWMRTELGIVLADEVLPLSIAPAWLPPFWLAGNLVCVVA
jgi:hypothetical protein